MQNGSLSLLWRIGGPPSWIFEINFLTVGTLEKHVLCHHAGLCEDRSYCCSVAEISQFFAFFLEKRF